MTAPRELVQFLLLSPDEQAQAIRRLAAAGWKAEDISRVTRLDADQVLTVIEAQVPAKCPRTGVPASFCTCIGPHEAAS